MLKSLFAAIGVGGATVDTRLHNPRLRPGELLRGEVTVNGGAMAQDLVKIELQLLAEIDGAGREPAMLASLPVCGPCRIPAGCEWRLPFRLALPPAMPVNHLPGLAGRPPSWLHTDLGLQRPRDADAGGWLQILPTPQMEVLLDAFSRLGWDLFAADVAGPERRQIFELRPRDAGWNWRAIALDFAVEQGGATPVRVAIAGGGGEHRLALLLDADWRRADWLGELRARLGL
ncbi:sporulation protein [Chromobacterium vaccinii]|uniref:sporulation protein n=1 Tax=Chromobacterium vaccinii TaxID=1108595 RepID=UPI003C782BCB